MTIPKLRHFAAALFVFLAPQAALAVDCTSANITLASQADVNSFQTDYGGGGTCDTVTGKLLLSGGVTDLTPLAALTSIFMLELGGTSLTSLSGLDGVNITHRIDFYDNLSLTNVDALTGVTNLEQTGANSISIFNSPMLTNLDGLANLTSTAGAVYIDTNALLASIGLTNLATVGGNLSIEINAALTDISGLQNLIAVEGPFALNRNPMLSSCSAISALVDAVDDAEAGPGPGSGGAPDVDGPINIYENATGCNSIAEILPQPRVEMVPVPTLSQWAVILLVGLMGLTVVTRRRV